MEINIPASLNGVYDQYDDDYKKIEGPGRVIVTFGCVEVGILPATREPMIHYDSRMDSEEEDRVASETIARWLREKLF